jgi:hypothetical protein
MSAGIARLCRFLQGDVLGVSEPFRWNVRYSSICESRVGESQPNHVSIWHHTVTEAAGQSAV